MGATLADRRGRIRAMLPLPMAALSYARDELMRGVEEDAPNDSPAIRAYLAEAEVNVPAPWCAAFVNWCARQAADDHGVESPLEAVPWQAYVQSYVEHGRNVGWTLSHDKADLVKPGDLFCLFYPSKGRYAHMGFVQIVPSIMGDSFRTIEGNTNDDGGREGVKVATRERPVTDRVLFLRWWEEA